VKEREREEILANDKTQLVSNCFRVSPLLQLRLLQCLATIIIAQAVTLVHCLLGSMS